MHAAAWGAHACARLGCGVGSGMIIDMEVAGVDLMRVALLQLAAHYWHKAISARLCGVKG
jgi:hypothetical protein